MTTHVDVTREAEFGARVRADVSALYARSASDAPIYLWATDRWTWVATAWGLSPREAWTRVPNVDPGPRELLAPIRYNPQGMPITSDGGWRRAPEGIGVDAADITADMETQYRLSVGA